MTSQRFGYQHNLGGGATHLVMWTKRDSNKPLSLDVYIVADEAAGSTHKQTHSSERESRQLRLEGWVVKERERRRNKERERMSITIHRGNENLWRRSMDFSRK